MVIHQSLCNIHLYLYLYLYIYIYSFLYNGDLTIFNSYSSGSHGDRIFGESVRLEMVDSPRNNFQQDEVCAWNSLRHVGAITYLQCFVTCLILKGN